MATASYRRVILHILAASVYVYVGFLVGRSGYRQQVVKLGQPRGATFQPASESQVAIDGKQVMGDDSGKQDHAPFSAPGQQNRQNQTVPKPVCNVFNIHAPSHDKHECLQTKWQPPFYICIHSVEIDIYVSKYIKDKGIWEKHHLGHFQNLLNKDASYGVIDIGANIGEYALLAATLGRPVVAVEARLLHVEMIHHAVQINQLANTTNEFILLHNAISDNHNELQIHLTKRFNQGRTETVERSNGSVIPASEVSKVPAITMDDLTEVVPFRKAILKIDIEGSEHKAISHCEKLLSKVYIPYIFMEWAWHRKNADEGNSIINILTRNGYAAYVLNKTSLSGKNMQTWPPDIIWKHKDASF